MKGLNLNIIDYYCCLFCTCKQRKVLSHEKLPFASIWLIFHLKRSISPSCYIAKYHIVGTGFLLYVKKIRWEATEYLLQVFHCQLPNRTNLSSESHKTLSKTESEEGINARSKCEEWNEISRYVPDLKDLESFKR